MVLWQRSLLLLLCNSCPLFVAERISMFSHEFWTTEDKPLECRFEVGWGKEKKRTHPARICKWWPNKKLSSVGIAKLKFYQGESGGLGTSSVASVWHLLCRCHLGSECYAKKKKIRMWRGPRTDEEHFYYYYWNESFGGVGGLVHSTLVLSTSMDCLPPRRKDELVYLLKAIKMRTRVS